MMERPQGHTPSRVRRIRTTRRARLAQDQPTGSMPDFNRNSKREEVEIPSARRRTVRRLVREAPQTWSHLGAIPFSGSSVSLAVRCGSTLGDEEDASLGETGGERSSHHVSSPVRGY